MIMTSQKEKFEKKRRQRSFVIAAILVAVVAGVYWVTLNKGPGFIDERARAGVQPLQ